MTTNETLGQRLQRLRAAAGLTQAVVAEQAGVPASTLRNWEVDRREPGWRAVVRLAKVLGVTAEDLADTVPVDEAGKTARPAGPTKRVEAPAPRPTIQPGRTVQEASAAAAKADKLAGKRGKKRKGEG